MASVMRAKDLPIAYNAISILEQNLLERCDEIALVHDGGTYTFREVATRVDRVAAGLRDQGIRPGDVVGILSPDRPEWVFTFFATLKIGAVALGMNTLLTPREYEYMVNDSRARLLVVHAELLPSVAPILDRCPFVEWVVTLAVATEEEGNSTFETWLDRDDEPVAPFPSHREDICTLNYSSGTTGEPKGIPHAHQDLVLSAQLWGCDVLGLTSSDRTLGGPKLFFTFGLGGNLIFPWYVGASVVLFAGSPRSAEAIYQQIDAHRPTILYHAPTGYATMLADDASAKRYDVSSLRVCVSAGEALPAPIWQRFKDRFGVEIVDGIGSTENFHIFLSNRPGASVPGSSGREFPGYELRIVDGEDVDVAPGEVGNLLVKGETAALSYLHRAAQSRRTFRGEWLDTGDKYYRDENGNYYHAGRTDDMLKVGGIWVSPVEVESSLIGHDAVLECAVVGVCDADGLVKPKAYVVAKPGRESGDQLEAELIEHCRAQMAAYKRPRSIEFVATLPKTATGKIQRFRLRRSE